MNRSVIVTGAHGFIGRHVCRAFGAEGWTVHGIGHGTWSEKSESRRWSMSSWKTADLTAAALESLPGADAIVHCAGGSSVGAAEADPAGDRARTVGTTEAVAAWARRRPSTRVVLISSAAVYGNARTLPISEDAPLQPISHYGRHKLEAERICSGGGFPSALLRMFSVYGPGLRKQLLWDACEKHSRGERDFTGTGDERRDWLHVEDAARATLLAVEHAAEGGAAVNVASGTGTPNREVLSLLFHALGTPEAEPRFIGGGRPGDPQHYQADIARVRGWGFTPKWSLPEGIEAYARWYREGRSA